MSETKKCLNCAEPLNGSYCNQCGQRSDIPEISFREISSDFFSSVFNIDSPFPRTLSKLFTNPGELVDEYIKGRRKKYYAPVKYLVFCFFINLIVGEVIGFDPMENQRMVSGASLSEVSASPGYAVGSFLSKYLNYFVFLLPFSIAFYSKIFFWKSSYSFAERSVLGFYIVGQYMIISIIPVLLTKIDPRFFYLMYPLVILYMSFGYYTLHHRVSFLMSTIKSLIASILAQVSYILFATVIAVIIMKVFDIPA